MTKLSENFGGERGGTNLLARTAFVAIDVQREFCDPSHESGRGNQSTKDISKNISSFLSFIKDLKIISIAVFMDSKQEGVKKAGSGLYETTEEDWDMLFAKNTNSAFANGSFANMLRDNSIRHLVLCGFNAHVCLKMTALDAVEEGFRVTVLTDLMGQDNLTVTKGFEDFSMNLLMETLSFHGVELMTSRQFSFDVSRQNPQFGQNPPHP